MSLNVGELMATLGVDAAPFTAGIDRAMASLRGFASEGATAAEAAGTKLGASIGGGAREASASIAELAGATRQGAAANAELGASSARAGAALRETGAAGREAGAEIHEGMEEAESGLGSLKELIAPLLEFFAAEKIVDFAKESIEAGENVERTSNLIEQQLKNTGNAAGVSAEQVQDMATEIGDASGKSRAEILLSEQELLRFQNVRNLPGKGNDIFTRTSKDAADLAAVMHTDVPAAALILGKALDNPTVGLTRLTRAGVSFTSEQTKQIKSLVASGNLLGAQTIILNHFESGFSGAAAAAVTPLDRLKTSVANLKTTVGEALLPVLDAAIGRLADFGTHAADQAEKGLSQISAAFDALAEHNTGALEKALGTEDEPKIADALESLRDTVEAISRNVTADLRAILPGAESAAKGLLTLGAGAGGEALLGIEGLTKALHPLLVAVGAVAQFFGSHSNLFSGPLTGALALAVAFKAVRSAMNLVSGARGIGQGLANDLAKAQQNAAALTYSGSRISSTFGRIGSAALSPAGIAGIGIATAVAGIAIDKLVSHYEAGKQQVADLTSAIEQDTGALGANTKEVVINQLQQEGAFKDAGQLGISLQTLVAAQLGNAAAVAQVNAILKLNSVATQQASTANGEYGTTAVENSKADSDRATAAGHLSGILGDQTGQLKDATAAAKLHAEAEKGGADASGILGDQESKTAGKTRDATAATEDAKAQQQALAQQAKETANALQFLTTGLDTYATKAFASGQASDDFLTALQQLQQGAKDTKGVLDGDTQAAITNRENLRQAVEQGAALLQQDATRHESAGRILADYVKVSKQLRDTGTAAGESKKDVDAYIKQGLGEVPAKVSTLLGLPGIKDRIGELVQVWENTGKIPHALEILLSAPNAGAVVSEMETIQRAAYAAQAAKNQAELARLPGGAGGPGASVSSSGGIGADVAGGGYLNSPKNPFSGPSSSSGGGVRTAQSDLDKLLASYAKFQAVARSPQLLRDLEGQTSGIGQAFAGAIADLQQVMQDAGHQRAALTKQANADLADEHKARTYLADNAKAYHSAVDDLSKARAALAAAPAGSKAADKATSEIKHDQSVIAAYTKSEADLTKAEADYRKVSSQLGDLSRLPASVSAAVKQLNTENAAVLKAAHARDLAAQTLADAQSRLHDAVQARQQDYDSFASALTSGAANVITSAQATTVDAAAVNKAQTYLKDNAKAYKAATADIIAARVALQKAAVGSAAAAAATSRVNSDQSTINAYGKAQQSLSAAQAPGVSGGGLQRSLNNELGKIRRFSADLSILARAHLSPTIMRELAAQGEDALPVADALVKEGKKAIAALSNTQAEINRAAAVASKTAGNYLDDPTIAVANANVALDQQALNKAQAAQDKAAKTLQADLKRVLALGKADRAGMGAAAIGDLATGIDSKASLARINTAGTRIANQLKATIKRELGIKSPSTVFHGFGEQIVNGLVNGIGAKSGDARLAMLRIMPPKINGGPAVHPSTAAGPMHVTVKIGDTELREIIGAEVDDGLGNVRQLLAAGRN